MTGAISFATSWIKPESSAIFMIPSQSAITPIRPMAVVTELPAAAIAALVTSSILPLIPPKTTARMTRDNHMKLSTVRLLESSLCSVGNME